MAVTFTQDTRLGRLHTEIGADKLVLLRFTGTDHLNAPFDYRVQALSTEANLDFDALIGTHASVEIETEHSGARFFDGFVTSARWAGADDNGNLYDLTLRPWFWLASKRRQQRIFHNKTVIEILQEVLAPYSGLGSPGFEVKATKSYPTIEYTVQYGESDFAFACRQMERFGLSYFFTAQKLSHTLTIVDAADQLPVVAGETRPYYGAQGQYLGDEEHFWEWAPERNFTTGKIKQTDYNFKFPDAKMLLEKTGDAGYGQGTLEGYDYPGDYPDAVEGQVITDLRTAQERGQDARHRALGDCIGLGSGMRVTLAGEKPEEVKETQFLVLSATHTYASNAYGTGDSKSDERAFTGSYVLMPTAAPLAPPRRTAIPRIQGPQTAVVVGEGEIDCDEFGRVLVHFHWDLASAYSMRCRVSQSWAHKGYGGMIVPRIGMEVIVDFLDGDPDRPIVTGHVYNGKKTPYYDLPANKSRSVFRTDSHQGDGFNELRIEDQAGQEEIFWHAQKDRNEKVLHNHTERVDNNWIQSVGHNKALEVTNNQDEVIGGNVTLSIGPGFIGDVIEDAPIGDWQGIGALGVQYGEAGRAPRGEGNLTLTVQKSQTDTVGEHYTQNVGQLRTETTGNNYSLEVGAQYSVNVTNSHTDMATEKRTITAGQKIELICGESRITLLPSGTIMLSGTDFQFTASAKTTFKTGVFKVDADKIELN